MVQAKFRCMSVTLRVKDAEAAFKPVIAKNEDWPNGCDENKQFWEATPAGDALLRFSSPGAVDVEPGQYFLIKIVEVPAGTEGAWKLWKVAAMESQQDVCISLGWDTNRSRLAQAELNMSIANKDAWPHFAGKQGTYWSVEFSLADGDHEGCPCTG